MKKVFMIHGFKSQPNGGWRPWLMRELEKNDIWACSLEMPTPDLPVKEEWIETIKNSVKDNTEEVYLIGHSLGVLAILRYLEILPVGLKIGGAVLVSGPISEIKKEKYERVNNFITGSFDFSKIKNSCNNFTVIHGDNDPNVPVSDAEHLSKILSCDLILVKNGRHLNGLAGFYQLPEALTSLLKMIKV